MAADNSVNRSGNLGQIGDLRSRSPALGPHLSRRTVERLGGTADHGHVCTMFGKGDCDRLSYPPTTTGDDCFFTGQFAGTHYMTPFGLSDLVSAVGRRLI
jgi:hypothetical protein